MKHYVYTLAYPESMGGSVFYVGKGTGNRINDHEAEAKRGRKTNPYKNNIIRKIWSQGEQVVKEKIAFFETHQEACMYEIAMIFFLPGLTNLTYGGDGTMGIVVSDELRRKRSEAAKGRILSAEHRHKIGEGTKRYMSTEEAKRMHTEVHKGRKCSEEAKRMMSEAHQSHWCSDEFRRKQEAARKGRVLSEEAHQNMSESHKGRIITPQERQKISEANKGRKISDEHRHKISEANKNRKPSDMTRCKMSESAKKRPSKPEGMARRHRYYCSVCLVVVMEYPAFMKAKGANLVCEECAKYRDIAFDDRF